MTFVFKLYDITNHTSSEDYIQWSSDGTTFTVTNTDQFAKDILPRYFKHSNYASFLRQLNVYGFKRFTNRDLKDAETEQSVTDSISESFQHPLFLRGQMQLLTQIERRQPLSGGRAHRRSDSNKQSSEADDDDEPATPSSYEPSIRRASVPTTLFATTSRPKRQHLEPAISPFQRNQSLTSQSKTDEEIEATAAYVKAIEARCLTLEARCASLEQLCTGLQSALERQTRLNEATAAKTKTHADVLRTVMNTMTALASTVASSMRISASGNQQQSQQSAHRTGFSQNFPSLNDSARNNTVLSGSFEISAFDDTMRQFSHLQAQLQSQSQSLHSVQQSPTQQASSIMHNSTLARIPTPTSRASSSTQSSFTFEIPETSAQLPPVQPPPQYFQIPTFGGVQQSQQHQLLFPENFPSQQTLPIQQLQSRPPQQLLLQQQHRQQQLMQQQQQLQQQQQQQQQLQQQQQQQYESDEPQSQLIQRLEALQSMCFPLAHQPGTQ